jgi:hypothetical protein
MKTFNWISKFRSGVISRNDAECWGCLALRETDEDVATIWWHLFTDNCRVDIQSSANLTLHFPHQTAKGTRREWETRDMQIILSPSLSQLPTEETKPCPFFWSSPPLCNALRLVRLSRLQHKPSCAQFLLQCFWLHGTAESVSAWPQVQRASCITMPWHQHSRCIHIVWVANRLWEKATAAALGTDAPHPHWRDQSTQQQENYWGKGRLCSRGLIPGAVAFQCCLPSHCSNCSIPSGVSLTGARPTGKLGHSSHNEFRNVTSWLGIVAAIPWTQSSIHRVETVMQSTLLDGATVDSSKSHVANFKVVACITSQNEMCVICSLSETCRVVQTGHSCYRNFWDVKIRFCWGNNKLNIDIWLLCKYRSEVTSVNAQQSRYPSVSKTSENVRWIVQLVHHCL